MEIHARHFLAIVPEHDGHFVQASCRHLEEGSKVERVLQRWRLIDGGSPACKFPPTLKED